MFTEKKNLINAKIAVGRKEGYGIFFFDLL